MADKVFSSLLTLPLEIRVEVYRYALKLPDLRTAFKRAEADLAARNRDKYPPCVSPSAGLPTPSILLLNRQIYFEARAIPFEQTLTMREPPPYNRRLGKTVDITGFIGRSTLQKLQYVAFEMVLDFGGNLELKAALRWLELVKTLLGIWNEGNGLRQVWVRAKYDPPSKARGWTSEEAGHHRCVMDMLSRLRALGEKVPVIFTGRVEEKAVKRRPFEIV